jgi:hypothetical protein
MIWINDERTIREQVLPPLRLEHARLHGCLPATLTCARSKRCQTR